MIKNSNIIADRVAKGLCAICGKDITDKKTLCPIKETKSVIYEGFQVFICDFHPTPKGDKNE